MSVSNDLPSDDTTIFSTLSQFPDIIVNPTQKMKTREFLDASSGVVILVGKFGKMFSPVIYDLNGNIKKITQKYEEDVEKYDFIEDMILKLKESGELVVVDALQWLRRGLHFISHFFQLVIQDNVNHTGSPDLSPFIETAYKETLERYHGWLGSQLFHILLKFTPSRQNFFNALALEKPNKDVHVILDMQMFNQRLAACINKLILFYDEHQLETNHRV